MDEPRMRVRVLRRALALPRAVRSGRRAREHDDGARGAVRAARDEARAVLRERQHRARARADGVLGADCWGAAGGPCGD